MIIYNSKKVIFFHNNTNKFYTVNERINGWILFYTIFKIKKNETLPNNEIHICIFPIMREE